MAGAGVVLFLSLCATLWTSMGTSRLVVSNSMTVFSSETVRSSSLGNITVISYGFHAEWHMPSWARKAFLVEAESWDPPFCGIELLAVIIGPQKLRSGNRRWGGSLSLYDILDKPLGELHCLSAPTYGHPYPIPEPVVPRTLALFCRSSLINRHKCPDFSEKVIAAKLTISTDDLTGHSATFEPRPLTRLSKFRQEKETRRENKRVMVICVCPLPSMQPEMKAKLHLWIAYHRYMGLSVAVAVESTNSVDGLPISLLSDDEVTIYAPGILSSISFYHHVGGKKRGKYRRHFDTDKTLTTTFLRFESRIVRNTGISIVIDFDEFLYAPKAPHISKLMISASRSSWQQRCDALQGRNRLEDVAGLKRVVSGNLDTADPRAAVTRPDVEGSILSIFKVEADKVFKWPPAELDGLVSQGGYIRSLILNKFSCAVDKQAFGIQIELPRTDVVNENFSSTCMSDNLAVGKYSLFPCMEYMDVLQKGTAKKRSFKNKILNIGQPCPGDMIHSSCVRQVRADRHAYGTSCSCNIYIQDELVILHHWFRGISPRHVKQQVCAKAAEASGAVVLDTLENYHKNYYESSIQAHLTKMGENISCTAA